jgi:hypothetical protein
VIRISSLTLHSALFILRLISPASTGVVVALTERCPSDVIASAAVLGERRGDASISQVRFLDALHECIFFTSVQNDLVPLPHVPAQEEGV